MGGRVALWFRPTSGSFKMAGLRRDTAGGRCLVGRPLGFTTAFLRRGVGGGGSGVPSYRAGLRTGLFWGLAAVRRRLAPAGG